MRVGDRKSLPNRVRNARCKPQFSLVNDLCTREKKSKLNYRSNKSITSTSRAQTLAMLHEANAKQVNVVSHYLLAKKYDREHPTYIGTFIRADVVNTSQSLYRGQGTRYVGKFFLRNSGVRSIRS